MSVRFDAAADFLQRTTNLPDFTTWTFMAWIWPVSYPAGAANMIFTRGSATSGRSTDFYVQGSSSRLAVASSDQVDNLGSTLAVGSWYHVALTKAGTAAVAYVAGVTDITATLNADNATGDTMVAALYNDLTQFRWDGRLRAIKLWSGVALSGPEIKREMWYERAVRRANLYMETPLRNNWEAYRDLGPGLHDWTANGTLTTEPDPLLVGLPVQPRLALLGTARSDPDVYFIPPQIPVPMRQVVMVGA